MSHVPTPATPEAGRLAIRRAPGLPAIELHEGVAFRHFYPPHWHDEYFLTVITGGEGIFRCGRVEHRAPAGTLVFVAPGEVHSHAPGRGGRSFRSLHAGGPFVGELAPDLSRFARSRIPRSGAIRDTALAKRFLALHRLLERDGDPIEKEARLLSFLAELLEAGTAAIGPPSTPERMAVRRARERLDEPDASRVSLRELAAAAALSPFHFHRLFRTQIGLPPHEYLLRRRLLRARALLSTGQPAAYVAAATGFSDQSHLTRHFKRLLGVTPSAYARRSKNVQD
jgi:AraC-like DNA-binding protein